MTVFGRRLQQRTRAGRVGGDAHAVEVDEPEQIPRIGVAGAAGGAEQLDRFGELQRTQRCARRLQGILRPGMPGGCCGRGQTDDAAEPEDAKRGDPAGAFAAHSRHAVPYLVSTSIPIERRKSFGRMPPALTITASLATLISPP